MSDTAIENADHANNNFRFKERCRSLPTVTPIHRVVTQLIWPSGAASAFNEAVKLYVVAGVDLRHCTSSKTFASHRYQVGKPREIRPGSRHALSIDLLIHHTPIIAHNQNYVNNLSKIYPLDFWPLVNPDFLVRKLS